MNPELGPPDERPICKGCGAEIDPDCCGCGDSREGHDSMWSGHSFVPMGCNCMREPSRDLQQVLADALANVNAVVEQVSHYRAKLVINPTQWRIFSKAGCDMRDYVLNKPIPTPADGSGDANGR